MPWHLRCQHRLSVDWHHWRTSRKLYLEGNTCHINFISTVSLNMELYLTNLPAERLKPFLFMIFSGYRQSQFPRPGVRLHQQHSEMWYHIHRNLCSDTQLSSNKVLYKCFCWTWMLHVVYFLFVFYKIYIFYVELTELKIQEKKKAKQFDNNYRDGVSNLDCLQSGCLYFHISFSSLFQGLKSSFSSTICRSFAANICPCTVQQHRH